MKDKKFTLIATGLAVTFWFLDACVHFYLYRELQFELIPGDFNELWMRLTIVGLMILFGAYADYSTGKRLQQERELEAVKIYGSMMHASHHILNNLLNQMILFREEAERSRDFDPKMLELYDQAMQDASAMIQRLSEVEKINQQDIWQSVRPMEQHRQD